MSEQSAKAGETNANELPVVRQQLVHTRVQSLAHENDCLRAVVNDLVVQCVMHSVPLPNSVHSTPAFKDAAKRNDDSDDALNTELKHTKDAQRKRAAVNGKKSVKVQTQHSASARATASRSKMHHPHPGRQGSNETLGVGVALPPIR